MSLTLEKNIMTTTKQPITIEQPQISVLFSKKHLSIFIRLFFLRVTIGNSDFYINLYKKSFLGIGLGIIGFSITWKQATYTYTNLTKTI